MEIFISKNGKQVGPYSEEQARDMLNAGMLADDDLAWHKQLTNWTTLQAVLGVAPPPLQSLARTPQPQPLSTEAGSSAGVTDFPGRSPGPPASKFTERIQPGVSSPSSSAHVTGQVPLPIPPSPTTPSRPIAPNLPKSRVSPSSQSTATCGPVKVPGPVLAGTIFLLICAPLYTAFLMLPFLLSLLDDKRKHDQIPGFFWEFLFKTNGLLALIGIAVTVGAFHMRRLSIRGFYSLVVVFLLSLLGYSYITSYMEAVARSWGIPESEDSIKNRFSFLRFVSISTLLYLGAVYPVFMRAARAKKAQGAP